MTHDFSKFVAPGIPRLKPYVPGKPIEELERELGISNTIKLASNENPLGPSPKAVEAAQKALAGINLYPDDSAFRLRNKLAEKFGLDQAGLILGNGSSDVIDMLARTFLAPGSNAVMSQYSFAMYPIYTTASGAECRMAKALPADHAEMPYGHDLDAMAGLVDENTRVVFIANPNNPTGTWLGRDELRAFIEKLPSEVVVLLDEAYTEYVTLDDFADGLGWIKDFPNLLVTRTFSKIYGLAGFRVGFGAAQPHLAQLVSRVRHPFNVNLVALAAAEAALDDDEFIAQSRESNQRGLEQLRAGFERLGLTAIPSIGNFIAVRVGQGKKVNDALLREGVIVRPVDNYDMPEFIRISVGTESQNQRLLDSLARVLSQEPA